MADAWPDPGPPVSPAAPTTMLDRVSGPQPDHRADSGYAVPPVPAGPDDQPGRHRVAWSWRAGLMTEAPAQPRDWPGPASPGSDAPDGPAADGPAPHGGRPPISPELMAPRGRWSRVGWMFAVIWLIYLAQPASKLWSDPDLARRYLGLAKLADAVRRVASGLRVVDPSLAAETLAAGDSPLTPRETDVLRTARDGGTVADIAASLHLSEGTVRNHLSAAIGKTGARTRAEAVRLASANGWLLGN